LARWPVTLPARPGDRCPSLVRGTGGRRLGSGQEGRSM
jgi:hypothetical protein